MRKFISVLLPVIIMLCTACQNTQTDIPEELYNESDTVSLEGYIQTAELNKTEEIITEIPENFVYIKGGTFQMGSPVIISSVLFSSAV